jgi:hypothetical protein
MPSSPCFCLSPGKNTGMVWNIGQTPMNNFRTWRYPAGRCTYIFCGPTVRTIRLSDRHMQYGIEQVKCSGQQPEIKRRTTVTDSSDALMLRDSQCSRPGSKLAGEHHEAGRNRSISEAHHLKTATLSKLDLIRVIKSEEGNFDCFGSAVGGECDRVNFMWRDDCFSAARETMLS